MEFETRIVQPREPGARPKFSIRRASEDDRTFLEEAWIRAGRDMMTAARGWDEVRERTQFRHQFELQSTWVVSHEHQDVGFMTVRIVNAAFELHTVCILPEWQNRGIGGALTRDLVELAAQVGRDVELSVLIVNSRARRLYERIGFEVVSDSEHHHRMRFACGKV